MIIKMFITDLCHFDFHFLHMIMKVSQMKTLKKCYHIISADGFSIAVCVSQCIMLPHVPHTVQSSDSSCWLAVPADTHSRVSVFVMFKVLT